MSTTKRNGQGRSKAQNEVLDRFFKGLPVKEATTPLYIVANSQDAKRAVQGDPEACALAQSCKRLFDSTAALFFRSRAYIDLPDTKGKRAVHRFRLTQETRDAIIEFDATGEFPPGGFVLLPFQPSQTLDAQRATERRRKDAVLKGEALKPRGTKPGVKRDDVLAVEGVRSGTGQVHFPIRTKTTA